MKYTRSDTRVDRHVVIDRCEAEMSEAVSGSMMLAGKWERSLRNLLSSIQRRHDGVVDGKYLVKNEAGNARIEFSLCAKAQHSARATPVLLLRALYNPQTWFSGSNAVPALFSPQSSVAELIEVPYKVLIAAAEEQRNDRLVAALSAALPDVTLASLDIASYSAPARTRVGRDAVLSRLIKGSMYRVVTVNENRGTTVNDFVTEHGIVPSAYPTANSNDASTGLRLSVHEMRKEVKGAKLFSLTLYCKDVLLRTEAEKKGAGAVREAEQLIESNKLDRRLRVEARLFLPAALSLGRGKQWRDALFGRDVLSAEEAKRSNTLSFFRKHRVTWDRLQGALWVALEQTNLFLLLSAPNPHALVERMLEDEENRPFVEAWMDESTKPVPKKIKGACVTGEKNRELRVAVRRIERTVGFDIRKISYGALLHLHNAMHLGTLTTEECHEYLALRMKTRSRDEQERYRELKGEMKERLQQQQSGLSYCYSARATLANMFPTLTATNKA